MSEFSPTPRPSFEPSTLEEREKLQKAIASTDMTNIILPSPYNPVNDAILAGRQEINGVEYMKDARGALVPVSAIKAVDLLIDEMTRKVHYYAEEISAQISRFKGHTFEDLNALQSLLEQEYGAKRGGAKGNVTFLSFDGLKKITVQIADQFYFGPELQVAKKLIDECLLEWGAASHEVIRALVNRIFSVEKEGQINRADIFSLLRLEVDDARWNRAMDAIKESIRVQGQKPYIRFYTRANVDAPWKSITIDIASAG